MARIESLEDVKKHAYAIVESCPDFESFLYTHLLGNPEMEALNKQFLIAAPYRFEYIGHYLTVGDVVKGEKVTDGDYPVTIRFKYVWICERLFVWWSISGIYADYNLCYQALNDFFQAVPRHRHVQGNSNLVTIINQLRNPQ
jgi:hypothetical protein